MSVSECDQSQQWRNRVVRRGPDKTYVDKMSRVLPCLEGVRKGMQSQQRHWSESQGPKFSKQFTQR